MIKKLIRFLAVIGLHLILSSANSNAVNSPPSYGLKTAENRYIPSLKLIYYNHFKNLGDLFDLGTEATVYTKDPTLVMGDARFVSLLAHPSFEKLVSEIFLEGSAPSAIPTFATPPDSVRDGPATMSGSTLTGGSADHSEENHPFESGETQVLVNGVVAPRESASPDEVQFSVMGSLGGDRTVSSVAHDEASSISSLVNPVDTVTAPEVLRWQRGSGDTFVLGWRSEPNTVYQVETSTNLLEWTPLGAEKITLSDYTEELIDLGLTTEEPARFFRVKIPPCESCDIAETIPQRDYKMGFSTWVYGPNESDKSDTYQFITDNADIYSEQIDHKIPWNAWINNTALPTNFTNDIDDRVSKRIEGHQLLLSVSLLNTDRSDLLEDYDGSIPSYSGLNDVSIEDAYFKHLDYLITQLRPDYLVMAMEINDLKINAENKWEEYKLLMGNVRTRIREAYPNLQLSESVTLHNWFEPEASDQSEFIADISDYVNANCDFASISFYPFFKGQHTSSEFQKAFDFLHSEVSIPIAFVETTHLAENLEIAGFNLEIYSDASEQMAYLETLLNNANSENYEFIIWWSHRDFDELWETFPIQHQDIGKLWRDTGILDEDGNSRSSYSVWKETLEK